MKKSKILLLFLAGYFAHDVVTQFTPVAVAEVAGMNHYELKRDRDFKKAVKKVVSGNCYVDGEYIYC
jgi:hypothetical protein